MSKLSDSQLLTNSNIVKNETTALANTASRIGTLFYDIVDSKINNITFTGYTATTKILLNTKLNATIFNTYTGATNTRVTNIETNFVTGTTTLGGIGLFNSKTNHNLKFKGLVAGANIVLTPSSTGITISSLGSGGTSGGWSTSGNTILNGNVNIIGSTGNTIQYTFNNIGTTQVNGAGLLLSNTTPAINGGQQSSPSLTFEGRSYATSTSNQSILARQSINSIQSGNLISKGKFLLESSVNGDPYNSILSVDLNSGKMTIDGDVRFNDPPLIEFVRHQGNIEVGRGQVGYLGSSEFNMTVNMDYTDQSHKYFDPTKNAIWTYLGNVSNEFGIQWTKAGHPNDDTMWTTYGKVIWKVAVLPNGSGEAVESGSKIYTQQIEFIDGNYISPSALLSLQSTVFHMNGMDNVQMPKLNVGTGTLPTGAIANFEFTGDTYIQFSNTTNGANYNHIRYIKNKTGSYNLGNGTKIVENDINGGVGVYGVRATSTVISNFSNIEYYWNTTNGFGASADRMVLTDNGDLKILSGKLILSTIKTGSTATNVLVRNSTGATETRTIASITGNCETKLDRVNTATGSSVTLDFNNYTQRIFKTGSLTNYVTTTGMTMSLSNNTNALMFNWIIFVNSNLSITMPSSFQMLSTETRWNSITKVLTLNYSSKKIEINGVFDGTNWGVKVSDFYI